MDIAQYIESGILEEYCLGLLSKEDEAKVIEMSLLYPEIKQELENIELSLENFSGDRAVEPRPELKNRILSSLSYSDYPLDINNLPEINQYSNLEDWLGVIQHLIPAEPQDDFFSAVIRHDGRVDQMLVLSRYDVPEEVHTDTLESLFILKGECRCMIGEEIFNLQAGDFIEIPLHVNHNIKLLTPQVMAILQHKALA